LEKLIDSLHIIDSPSAVCFQIILMDYKYVEFLAKLRNQEMKILIAQAQD